VKRKTATQLAEAIVSALEAHQLSAETFLQGLMNAPLSPAQKKMFRDKLFQASYRSAWVSIFRKLDEPEEAQLAEALAMFEALKTAPGKMRNLLKTRIKELPHEPGGAPRKIPVDHERAVCAEVEGLRSQHDTRGAIRKVALKRGVSERTIYRIWGKYHPKKKSRKSTSS